MTRRRVLTGAVAVAIAAGMLPGVAANAAPAALSATIRYTENDIPHIVARDYPGLGFGQGYAAAKDNLCGIADGLVTLSGQRSRLYGPDAKPGTLSLATDNLSSDLYFRGLADARTVERLIAQPAPLGPQPEVREMVRGYAAGYNSYLAEARPTKCAPALRPMTELDIYRRVHALSMLLGQSSSAETITKAMPPSGAAPAPSGTLDTDIAGPGSNSIAFGRDATANGRGISVANPHLPWQGDLLWVQAQLTIPGKLDVSGAAFLGTPFLTLGHNDKLAWSGTIADGVVPVALFELPLVTGDPTAYTVDGKTEQMQRRDVTIQAKQADGTIRPVTRAQWWTRYGPVVTELRGMQLPWSLQRAYALADPNTENIRLLNTLSELGRTKSTGEFAAAIRRTQGSPIFNLLAADSAGRTVYSGLTSIPNVTDEHAKRCGTELGSKTFDSGLMVLDGSRSACRLGVDRDAVQPGILGPGNLPLLDRTDYVANSNESYWLTNLAQPMKPLPRIVGTANTARNVRTRGTLTEITDQLAGGRFDLKSAQDLVLSNRAFAAELAGDDTVTLCRTLPDLARACDALAKWDKKTNIDSRGALLFSRFWNRIGRLPNADLWRVQFDQRDPLHTPDTLNAANPALAKALLDAVKELDAAEIAYDAPLGDHQFVERDGKRIPVGGGRPEMGVFNVVSSNWDPARGYATIGGDMRNNSSGYLRVVSFNDGECPDAKVLLTYGSAEQAEMFGQKLWITERFCERDIRASPALRVVHVRGR